MLSATKSSKRRSDECETRLEEPKRRERSLAANRKMKTKRTGMVISKLITEMKKK
jgi:hypothetical protein